MRFKSGGRVWRLASTLLILTAIGGCELPDALSTDLDLTGNSEISFYMPEGGVVLEEPATLSVTGERIWYVDFSVDGAILLRDGEAPFEFVVDPVDHGAGDHQLTIRVVRNNETEESESVSIRIDAPEPPPAPEPDPLVFNLPDEGATVEESALVSVEGDGITEVRFQVDGDTLVTDTEAPWDWTLVPETLANGEHTLTVLATRFDVPVTASITFFVANPAPPPPPDGEMDKTGRMWEYLEWSLSNPSHSGNPFDLVAKVTFRHSDSGETRTTEMFYMGGDRWHFRFTGTKTGTWTFTTSSGDSDLDGKAGTVTVEPNTDTKIRGYLKTQGQKYAIQVGNEATLEAYRFAVYMNEKDYPAHGDLFRFADPNRTRNYLAKARSLGFDTIFINEVSNQWFELGARTYDEHDSSDPDLETFAIMDTIITTAHREGGRVHFWMWGDEQRHWTPIGVGGINGTPDRRLQRYLAARLGPLPGWTVGYGFDLQEWVSDGQLRDWADYVKDHLGWEHLMWGRGRSNSSLDVVSYSGYGTRSVEEAMRDMDSDPGRPHLYEERDTHGRIGMSATRKGIWRYAMAGGMGGFWGLFPSDSDYPRPHELATAGEFWRGRFLLDMDRAHDLSDGYCLKTSDNRKFVFYKEGTTSIRLDLSGMDGARRAVAVDANKSYAEIDLGTLDPVDQTWSAPYDSDWAIAVGTFDR